jgi:hypothetical protein
MDRMMHHEQSTPNLFMHAFSGVETNTLKGGSHVSNGQIRTLEEINGREERNGKRCKTEMKGPESKGQGVVKKDRPSQRDNPASPNLKNQKGVAPSKADIGLIKSSHFETMNSKDRSSVGSPSEQNRFNATKLSAVCFYTADSKDKSPKEENLKLKQMARTKGPYEEGEAKETEKNDWTIGALENSNFQQVIMQTELKSKSVDSKNHNKQIGFWTNRPDASGNDPALRQGKEAGSSGKGMVLEKKGDIGKKTQGPIEKNSRKEGSSNRQASGGLILGNNGVSAHGTTGKNQNETSKQKAERLIQQIRSNQGTSGMKASPSQKTLQFSRPLQIPSNTKPKGRTPQPCSKNYKSTENLTHALTKAQAENNPEYLSLRKYLVIQESKNKGKNK